jgi:hypothetical protein
MTDEMHYCFRSASPLSSRETQKRKERASWRASFEIFFLACISCRVVGKVAAQHPRNGGLVTEGGHRPAVRMSRTAPPHHALRAPRAVAQRLIPIGRRITARLPKEASSQSGTLTNGGRTDPHPEPRGGSSGRHQGGRRRRSSSSRRPLQPPRAKKVGGGGDSNNNNKTLLLLLLLAALPSIRTSPRLLSSESGDAAHAWGRGRRQQTTPLLLTLALVASSIQRIRRRLRGMKRLQRSNPSTQCVTGQPKS